MSTTSSVGTGKTYSDPGTFHSAFAAGGWIGEVYKGEITTTTGFTFSGKATSSTDYIALTAAAGEGFRDDAGALTNPLRYDASKGAAIRKTNSYNPVLSIGEGYVTISKLQVSHTGAGNSDQAYGCAVNGLSGVVVDGCILEANPNSSVPGFVHWQRSGVILNSLVVNRGTTGGGITFEYAGTPATGAINVTVVKPSDKAGLGNAFECNSGTPMLKNCVGMGFNAFVTSGTFHASSSNNASDKAIAFGTANQASKTYSTSNQFENAADATRDFRAKAGGDLVPGNGVDVSSSYAGTSIGSSIDIVGTARGTSWGIGAWQLSSTSSYTLTAAFGSFAETGQPALFNIGMPSAQGAFALNGQAANLFVGSSFTLTAAMGSFALSGQAAVMNTGLVSGQGAFALSGQATAFAFNAPVAQGAFALTGQAAPLGMGLVSAKGDFTLSGQAAVFPMVMGAAPGVLALTGINAPLGIGMASGQGAFASTGNAAAFALGLTSDTGGFLLFGQAATLIDSGGTAPITSTANPAFIVSPGKMLTR